MVSHDCILEMWRVMWLMHFNATLEKCHKKVTEKTPQMKTFMKPVKIRENYGKNTQKRFTFLFFGYTKYVCTSHLTLMLRIFFFFCVSCLQKKPPPDVLLRSSATSFRATSFRFCCFSLETKKDGFSRGLFCFPFSGNVFFFSKTKTEKSSDQCENGEHKCCDLV